MTKQLSIIIPAKNEALGLDRILSRLISLYPEAEIIVVDDGSSDTTAEVVTSKGAKVISHRYSKGNGAAIKTGIRQCSGEVVVCMDADGQHQPEDIAALINKLEEGYDMVVGARTKKGQAGYHRYLANSFYNFFYRLVVGHQVRDLTSGFRVAKRALLLEFVDLLPNKFSYPTTITMCFFRSGYSVGYTDIDVLARVEGSLSHINPIKDGLRFLLIIFKIGTLYSPLKIFAPVSFSFFSAGLVYYLYTYMSDGRFTNMGALLFATSVIIFMIGLVSEQVTTLMFKDSGRKE